jgi:heme/copper-type cytochrome/quinol oxidase subunit 3
MLFFLAAEAMFFAGLVSAYVVLSARFTAWPPPGQPRLPVAITGFNTLVLLWSGLSLALAARTSARKEYLTWLSLSVLGGAAFLAIQGREWAELVSYGLATANSVYAGTFYAVIGVHALHVLGGVTALGTLVFKAFRSPVRTGFEAFFAATRMYWYFVVGVWPVLYGIVYWH